MFLLHSIKSTTARNFLDQNDIIPTQEPQMDVCMHYTSAILKESYSLAEFWTKIENCYIGIWLFYKNMKKNTQSSFVRWTALNKSNIGAAHNNTSQLPPKDPFWGRPMPRSARRHWDQPGWCNKIKLKSWESKREDPFLVLNFWFMTWAHHWPMSLTPKIS